MRTPREFVEEYNRESGRLHTSGMVDELVEHVEAYVAELRSEPDRTQSGITLTANGVEVPPSGDDRIEMQVGRWGRRWWSIQCSLPEPARFVVVHGWVAEPVAFEGITTAGNPDSTLPYRFKGEASR